MKKTKIDHYTDKEALDFHKNKKTVSTASLAQVRQPIYSGSVQTWKRYGAHLDSLKEILEPVFPDLPEALS